MKNYSHVMKQKEKDVTDVWYKIIKNNKKRGKSENI